MKRKILLLTMLFITVCFLIACSDKKKENNKNNDPIIEESEEQSPKYNDDDLAEINGIQQYLFDNTKGNIPLTLENIETKEIVNITPISKYTDFFEYIPMTGATPDVVVDEELPLKPSETSLYAKVLFNGTEEESDDGVFVFGAVNESDKDTYFQDARTVYISYRGVPGWKLCGITTKMSSKEVKEVVGEPAQEVESDWGNTYSYFILKDEHTYSLTIIFDEKKCVQEIALNIDNYPIFAGQTVE